MLGAMRMSVGSDTARFWGEPSVADRTADRWGKPLSEQPVDVAGSDSAPSLVATGTPTWGEPPPIPNTAAPPVPVPVPDLVDTTSPSHTQPEIARFYRRITADLIDLGVVLAIIIALAFPLAALWPTMSSKVAGSIVIAISAIYIFAFQLVWGRTVGMFLAGITVVGRNCASLTLQQALIRTILWIPDLAIRTSSIRQTMAALERPRTMVDRQTTTWVLVTTGPLDPFFSKG